MLERVVFLTDFSIDQKLPSVEILASRKIGRKKENFFVPAGRLTLQLLSLLTRPKTQYTYTRTRSKLLLDFIFNKYSTLPELFIGLESRTFSTQNELNNVVNFIVIFSDNV